MRLPRDVSGDELAQALQTFGYRVSRQTGSHVRLTTVERGEHHVTIPRHRSLRVGTLAGNPRRRRRALRLDERRRRLTPLRRLTFAIVRFTEETSLTSSGLPALLLGFAFGAEDRVDQLERVGDPAEIQKHGEAGQRRPVGREPVLVAQTVVPPRISPPEVTRLGCDVEARDRPLESSRSLACTIPPIALQNP